jgi:sugar phosphate isomerase/epimerase
MVAYGFERGHLATDLVIAQQLKALFVEILPDWRRLPDPKTARRQVEDAGLRVHSVHGCWGGQSIKALRVDAAATDEHSRSASVDDLRRCLDWLYASGGRCLIVHPGVLSESETQAERRQALATSLRELVQHARPLDALICVENMPPGVHPGSEMSALSSLIAELNDPHIRLALDTGHAHISATTIGETAAAGQYLASTHVHDNMGKSDVHLPPGLGTIDWRALTVALNEVDYRGPIMLECIRYLREQPDCIDDSLLARLRLLTGGSNDEA